MKRESTLRGATTSSSFVGADEEISIKAKIGIFWHAKGREVFYKGLYWICVVLSVVIVIGEFSIMFQLNFRLITADSGAVSFQLFLVVLLLFYLTLTTYYGLFNIQISGLYGLDSSGRTDSYSLLQSAMRLTALAAPLCFNFLKRTNVKETQFKKTLNPMDAIPVLGKGFQRFFPCCLMLLCVFNYFEIWSKICKTFGLEDLAFTSIFDEMKIVNGRELLKIERAKQKRNIDRFMGDLELREKKSAAKGSPGSSDGDDNTRLL